MATPLAFLVDATACQPAVTPPWPAPPPPPPHLNPFPHVFLASRAETFLRTAESMLHTHDEHRAIGLIKWAIDELPPFFNAHRHTMWYLLVRACRANPSPPSNQEQHPAPINPAHRLLDTVGTQCPGARVPCGGA